MLAFYMSMLITTYYIQMTDTVVTLQLIIFSILLH